MTDPSLSDQALVLHQSGRLEEAEALYHQAIAADEAAFQPRHFLGILKLQQGRADEALDLIGAALAIDPGNPEILINYGNAQKLCGRAEDALASFERALGARPGYAKAPYNRAILLAELGRAEEALKEYARALALRPDYTEALHERALLLRALARPEAALADFDRLLQLLPDFAQGWSNRAVLLEEMNRLDEALASVDQALTRNPASAEALHNRGNIRARFRDFDRALCDYDQALALDPSSYAKAWINRGILLLDMKRFAEASESFTRALAIEPKNAAALRHRGKLAWLEFRDYQAARTDLEAAVAADPDLPFALGDLVYLKMHGADWQDRARDFESVDQGVRAGKPVVEPFIYQGISASPAELQACAAAHAARLYPAAQPLTRPGRRRKGKIRLGYLSGEFREQATALLTAGLYECHDKNRFEIIGFDNGVSDASPLRKRLESAFDKIIPISLMSDAQAAGTIAGEEIDILINLNGYFGERRMGIFASRPAPIQVNYLGFPMSLGAPYMDYIIADRIVIPQDERRYYTEQVVYLPDSYQANDFKRPIAAEAPSRAQCGLPENGFVFCSFNQAYKLSPEMFDRWMAILKLVPGSVLWLLEGHAVFRENIRREAASRGVAPERIVFAPIIANDKHLARFALADLFLDTLPCNAHTTASDALWAGVPLITCRGTAFSGRVAASLLSAIGLPELICENLDDYEALAVALANNPARLADLRGKLTQNRLTKALFDTARYTRHLEAAFLAMVERHESGLPPQSLAV